MSNSLPTGTVTFLFTDIEGSTKRWEHQPQVMDAALRRHDELLRLAIEANGGYVFKTVGDAFCAAFQTPHDALAAALAAQRALQAEDWDTIFRIPHSALRIRAALHTGVAMERDADYFGQPVNRVARLLSAGHGGQTLLSLGTYEMVRDALPTGAELRDMGEHRLKDLIRPERVFQLAGPDLLSEFPPLNTLDNRPNNLPAQPTPLIGREKEIGEVCDLLRRPDVRLVTLTGTGGTGKTRLGLQVAAELLDDFKHGVFLVSLAPISDPGLVASTIAKPLGVQETAGKPLLDSLKDYLREKQLLLVLDNFEQVASAAPLASELLASCPQLKVEVTSRVSLHLSGEHEYPVPPLSLPDHKSLPPLETLTQYEAVRLFIERGRAVKPDFEVNNHNAPSVAEICVRLDGLPLAIELAAARVKYLPPQGILERLGSRLKLLTGGARDLPARQQTLRGTIEWSYDLLEEAEKKLFRRLGVFVGGCRLEAAEGVCDLAGDLDIEVLDGVMGLVDKSLLKQEEEEAGGEARFWMLETIREYALERLEESGEGEAVRGQHARLYLALAEEAEPQLRGAAQVEWLARLEEEYGNIRAALAWARESKDLEIALGMVGAIWRFWVTHSYFSEGREQLAGALSMVGSADDVRSAGLIAAKAKALAVGASLALTQGDYEAASAFNRESMAISRELGDGVGIALALAQLGNIEAERGNYAEARTMYEQSLAIRRELGDKLGISSLLGNLGVVSLEQGDFSGARVLYEEALTISQELGDKYYIARLLNNLGNVIKIQGDYPRARVLHEEGLRIRRELGDKRGISMSLNNLGDLVREQGDFTGARSLYEESLAMRLELGDKRGIALTLSNVGDAVRGLGDHTAAHTLYQESLLIRRELKDKRGIVESLERLAATFASSGMSGRAVRLWGAAETLREDINSPGTPNERARQARDVAAIRSHMDEAAWETAWEEGRAMSMEQAIEYALA